MDTYVTDVVIISHKDKCPAGYKIVNVTTGGHDADLYEGSLAKRGERYLCFAQIPGSSSVVTDISIVKEKDDIPTGFTAIRNCKNDTSEKSLRKHICCIRTTPIQNTQRCVVDIVAVKHSKGETTPQHYHTITNDVNGLHISYKVTPVVQRQQQPPPMQYPYHANMPYRPPNMQPSYPMHPYGAYPRPPQHPAPGMPVTTHTHHDTSATRQSNLTRQSSVNKLASAIQGIQFQVNPKFEMMWNGSEVPNKPTKIRSLDDIEKKYGYTFETEQNLLRSR